MPIPTYDQFSGPFRDSSNQIGQRTSETPKKLFQITHSYQQRLGNLQKQSWLGS
ncbi:hypothetical protein ALO98_200176 [Pseudomonas syringae pv. tagetis]|nr:hypothetical protein ALO98_200176 [Pseudomonas syringae pv. tagetis]